MTNEIKHSVLRTFAALCRGEHYSASELGETFFDAPCEQLNWFENANIRDEICTVRKITPDTFSKQMIFTKPTVIQNSVYCASLRKIFGIEILAEMAEFNEKAVFILPNGSGVFIPIKVSGLISFFEFVRLSSLKPKIVLAKQRLNDGKLTD